MTTLPDRAVGLLVRSYFTKTNLLAHAIIYPILMAWEGGDYHLFLDGISIEAVFVGLMVGISTKTVIAHSRSVRQLVHEVAAHIGAPHDHD